MRSGVLTPRRLQSVPRPDPMGRSAAAATPSLSKFHYNNSPFLDTRQILFSLLYYSLARLRVHILSPSLPKLPKLNRASHPITMTSLPAIDSLPHLPDSDLTQVLDLLFEPSPPLHELSLPVLRTATFPSYHTLIVAVNAQLTALAHSDKPEDVAKLSEILCSHPRLGEKKVDSEQSRTEQAQLQTGGEEETEKLAALNREYEAKFPGLRYV